MEVWSVRLIIGKTLISYIVENSVKIEVMHGSQLRFEYLWCISLLAEDNLDPSLL